MLKITCLEKNEELIIDFDLFGLWTRLTLEHQVDGDSYEGQIRKFSFLPFEVYCCFVFGLLNGPTGLLKICVL
jgi:hypothetical protein